MYNCYVRAQERLIKCSRYCVSYDLDMKQYVFWKKNGQFKVDKADIAK